MGDSDLMRRARHRLSGLAFRHTVAAGVSFAGPMKIQGRWPVIDNKGSMRFGVGVITRAPRLGQAFTTLPGGTLAIGDRSFINEGVNICAARSVAIGDHAKIGDMVYIYDTDFHQLGPDDEARTAPVAIGANVWLCAGVTVLPGATIGDHSVIGAGSVVLGAIPSRSVAVGRPARVVRSFEAPDGWTRS